MGNCVRIISLYLHATDFSDIYIGWCVITTHLKFRSTIVKILEISVSKRKKNETNKNFPFQAFICGVVNINNIVFNCA